MGLTLPPVPPVATATGGYSLYTQYRITVGAQGGFVGTITFQVSDLPTGVNALFDYPSLTLNPSVITAATTLLVAADVSAPPSQSTLTVTATGGGIERTTTVGLVVDNFTITAYPDTQIVPRRNSASYTFTVNPDGFEGNLYFQVRGLPKGATATFNPQTVTVKETALPPYTTTMTVTTKGSTTVGTYPLVVSPYLWAQESRVSLIVQ